MVRQEEDWKPLDCSVVALTDDFAGSVELGLLPVAADRLGGTRSNHSAPLPPCDRSYVRREIDLFLSATQHAIQR